jgi:transposase
LHLIVRRHNASLEPMAAYSIDLRQKILHAYERRLGSQQTLAEVFGVSLSCIEKVLRRSRTPGELSPKPHAGGQKPRVDATAQAVVRQVVHEHPDATVDEFCTRLANATGGHVSLATMCRVGRRWGLPRKTNHSLPRSARRHASSRHGRPTAN